MLRLAKRTAASSALLSLTLLAVGCGAGQSPGEQGTDGTQPSPPSQQQSTPDMRGVRFSASAWPGTNFRIHSVPLDEFTGGGPGRDDIPPIDSPKFETVEQAGEWLDNREPVQAVEIKGDARAYPQQILVWHEIVNDTVGGEPVAVTY